MIPTLLSRSGNQVYNKKGSFYLPASNLPANTWSPNPPLLIEPGCYIIQTPGSNMQILDYQKQNVIGSIGGLSFNGINTFLFLKPALVQVQPTTGYYQPNFAVVETDFNPGLFLYYQSFRDSSNNVIFYYSTNVNRINPYVQFVNNVYYWAPTSTGSTNVFILGGGDIACVNSVIVLQTASGTNPQMTLNTGGSPIFYIPNQLGQYNVNLLTGYLNIVLSGNITTYPIVEVLYSS